MAKRRRSKGLSGSPTEHKAEITGALQAYAQNAESMRRELKRAEKGDAKACGHAFSRFVSAKTQYEIARTNADWANEEFPPRSVSQVKSLPSMLNLTAEFKYACVLPGGEPLSGMRRKARRSRR